MNVSKRVLDLRDLYQHRKQNALCVKCGAGLQEDDGVVCVECVDLHAESVANKRARYRRQGKCVDCGDPRTAGRSRCAECQAANAERSARYRSRRDAGIVPIARAAPRRERATYREIAAYRPLDEATRRPRVRLLLALSWMEWPSAKELFARLSIDLSDEGESHEYDAHMQMLGRLVKMGLVDRRGVRGNCEYQITTTGRAEVAEIRSGNIKSRVMRKAA